MKYSLERIPPFGRVLIALALLTALTALALDESQSGFLPGLLGGLLAGLLIGELALYFKRRRSKQHPH